MVFQFHIGQGDTQFPKMKAMNELFRLVSIVTYTKRMKTKMANTANFTRSGINPSSGCSGTTWDLISGLFFTERGISFMDLLLVLEKQEVIPKIIFSKSKEEHQVG